MLKQTEGSHAVAEAVALCRPEVICAYPISPQTHIVEGVGELVKSGELTDQEIWPDYYVVAWDNMDNATQYTGTDGVDYNAWYAAIVGTAGDDDPVGALQVFRPGGAVATAASGGDHSISLTTDETLDQCLFHQVFVQAVNVVALSPAGPAKLDISQGSLVSVGSYSGDIQMTVEIEGDEDNLDHADRFWIANTTGGYNNSWTVTVKCAGVAREGVEVMLKGDEAYAGYNQGSHKPVFLDAEGKVISTTELGVPFTATATTDESGEIRNLRLGFKEGEAGRPGDIFKISVKTRHMTSWIDCDVRYYLAVYDKRALDIARTYCNNESIADWTGRESNATVSDAVAYSFGCKDALVHFNRDMTDWMNVMSAFASAEIAFGGTWSVTTAPPAR